MILYAESSAVLSWLLNEPRSVVVGDALQAAETIYASELTLLECHRALVRAVHLRHFTQEEADAVSEHLLEAAESWDVWQISTNVLNHAKNPFPEGEPIRALDAIHVATALVGRDTYDDQRESIPEFALLTLDRRVSVCARALRFHVLPVI